MIVLATSLEVHDCSIVDALHVAIVHQLVLLHYMLRSRVVYLEHLGGLFDRNTLGLHNVYQILSLFIVDLNVVPLSSKKIIFTLIILV